MLRPQRARNWFAVAMAVLCAVQGGALGTLHHLWCGHKPHVHYHAVCQAASSGSVTYRQWDHRHPAPTSPAHDEHNCLACRYVAERSVLPRTTQVTAIAVSSEHPQTVAPILLTAAAPSSYYCRAPPV